MAEDEEDFIFYGTPIEREEDTSARKRKAVADAGQLRSLPTWKQEVSPHTPSLVFFSITGYIPRISNSQVYYQARKLIFVDFDWLFSQSLNFRFSFFFFVFF